MSTHSSHLVWPAASPPTEGAPIAAFTYETYSRDHTVRYGTGAATEVSAAKEFRGNPALTNPEEMLVAALSSCHMLTFLALASRKGLVVTRYTDDAVGTLAKDDRGVISLTEVVLRPVVTFAEPIEALLLSQLHLSAHHGCFIANSTRTKVTVA